MTNQELEAWIKDRIARRTGAKPEEIDPRDPFSLHGIDSKGAAAIASELEEQLHRPLEISLLFEYPTIQSLAAFLTDGKREPLEPSNRAPAASHGENIAIVGMACRFPGVGAGGPAAFWDLLCRGGDAVGELSVERWGVDGSAPRKGGVLQAIDGFDARFFGILPPEAATMDPQQRLILELAWEALEDAGEPPGRLAGSATGVFIGASTNDYARQTFAAARPTGYEATGSALSVLAARVSYLLDLHGPSMAVDTACSSSLVALAMACRSLRDGESTLALAGGVNLLVSPELSRALAAAGMLAPDGRCKAFDARADGYVRGEGGAIVVLKPLGRALEDGDRIYAVVRGIAVNQDGKTNGLTAPSPRAQENVLRTAYRNAGVPPGALQYVEAHGTGTLLGDPIEAKALGDVVGKAPGRTSPCLVGSVKTNVGHLEAAAGIAGLVKTSLALFHREIPPSLHFATPNPHIPFGELSLAVVQERTPWPAAERALAGVSSFGFGGTNAHVVLEAAPAPAARPAPCTASVHVLPISARDPNALRALCVAYERRLADGISAGGLCYTAAARRTHHDLRLAVTGRDAGELARALAAHTASAHGAGRAAADVFRGEARKGHRPRIVFAFPGQGSQWAGMGLRTYAVNPVFAATLRRCDAVVRSLAKISVLEELGRSTESSRLLDTAIAQPVIVSLQLALCDMYRAWGIEPSAVVGHSVGEIAAACAAGVLELEEALRVAVVRGKVMALAPRGHMLAVELPEVDASLHAQRLRPHVGVAAINGPSSTVLAGDAAALGTLGARLEAEGVAARWLDVEYAFHSPHMESLQPRLLSELKPVAVCAPRIPIYSTVTGAKAADGAFDAAYWARGIREPVRFAAAVEAIAQGGCDAVLEIGGHPVLGSALRRTLASKPAVRILSSLRRYADEDGAVAASLAALYAAGAPVDWDGVFPEGGELVDLPTYPWQRERFWVERSPEPASKTSNGTPKETNGDAHPLLGAPVFVAGAPPIAVFSNEIDETMAPYLADYLIDGDTVLSPGAVLELMLEAVKRVVPDAAGFADVRMLSGLPLDNVTLTELQVRVETPHEGPATVQLHGRLCGEAEWLAVATATVERASTARGQPVSLAEIQSRCLEQIAPPELFRALRKAGVGHGPSTRYLADVWRQDGESLGRVRFPKRKNPDDSEGALRVLVDGALQSLAAALPQAVFDASSLAPAAIERFALVHTLVHTAVRSVRVHAVVRPQAAAPTLDLAILDEEGVTVAEIDGLALRPARAAQPTAPALPAATWHYRVEWRARPASPASPASTLSPDVPANARGRWLLVDPGGDAGPRLARQIEEGAGVCTRVMAADLPAIERALSESEEWRGIVHLGALDARDPAGAETACETTIALLRAIGDRGFIRSPRLWLVTQGAQAVDGHPASSPFQAPIWGLAKAIAFEQPDLRCTRIDLDPARDLAADLFREILVEDDEEQRILRDGSRLVPRLVSHGVGPGPGPSLRPDATYAITGGLGGLGIRVAWWLVGQGARNIALIGRREPGEAAREAIRELERAGARVMVARADVANRAELSEALSRIARDLPPLVGVLHLAGTRDDGALLTLDPARLRSVLRPKVHGAWNLHELTAGMELDFFVLFSSAAAVLGSPGQANYMAANAFLDALAHHRRSLGKPALAIDWGPWAEVGMAASFEDAFRASGIGMIGSAEGLDILGRLLGDTAVQVTVMPIDLATIFHLYPVVGGMAFFSELYGDEIVDVRNLGTEARVDTRPALDAELVPPRTETEAIIAGIWQRALHLDRIGVQDDFFALGGDSIFAAQIISQVQKRFAVHLDAQLMFEKFTIEEMARVVEQLIVAQLAAMTELEAEEELSRASP